MERSMATAAKFKMGMRNLVSGVCLITTLDEQSRYGMVATAVSSVAADPPMLLVCVNRSASLHDPVKRSGIFCVNILGHHGVEISEQFSNSALRDERFKTGRWTTLATGSPVLMDAMASLDCRVAEFVDSATHTIIVGRVEDVQIGEVNAVPLAYLNGSYGTFHKR